MATYNCSDSANSAYGAGNYSNCEGRPATIGAPDTGFFGTALTPDVMIVLLPLTVLIAICIAASITIVHKRKKPQ